VGSASAKDYEKEKNPLLITPGFKIGKEGLERTLEDRLRGQPGGQRVELTARGKLVRELEPKPDRSGQTVKLTIDAGLQEFVGRPVGRSGRDGRNEWRPARFRLHAGIRPQQLQ
jgi:penicillin-binding protein 2